MGASGHEGHVVVCGWNSTARDLIAKAFGPMTGRSRWPSSTRPTRTRPVRASTS